MRSVSFVRLIPYKNERKPDMKTMTTTILTSAALMTAAPAMAQQNDAENDMPAFCETAFMPADENKDGFMSKEEISKARDAEFAALDLNKDGSVDREELVNCIGQAEQKAREDFAAMQSEGDSPEWADLGTGGKTELSTKEYQDLTDKAWKSDNSDMKAAVSEDTDDAESFARTAVERFRMYDSNSDGVITQAEYEGEVEKDWNDKALNKRFDAMDADNSGALSPMEYRGAGTSALDMTDGTSDEAGAGDQNSDGSSATGEQTASDEATVPVVVYYYSLV